MMDERIIDAYVDEISAAMPGPSRDRSDLLDELRSGLLDAADVHRAAGLQAGAAAQAAVEEFGDPRELAAAYRPELTARRARRLVLGLVAVGPAIALLWAHAASLSDAGTRRQTATLWRAVIAPPVPLAAAAFLIAAVAAIGTLSITGRLTRWLPDRPGTAALAAAIGAYGTATADLAILSLLAFELVHGPGHHLSAMPVSAAMIASLCRFILARRAGRQCLTAHASL